MPVRNSKNVAVMSDEEEAKRTSITPYMERHQITFEHIATKNKVKFLAFLTAFSDAFASNWKTENVYGRMDPLAVFQNTQRTLTIGWSIPSEGFADGANNLVKIRNFIQMLYPVYEKGSLGVSGIKAAPLVRLGFVNLATEGEHGKGFTSLVGFIQGITFAPDMEAGFFDHVSSKGKPFLYPKSVALNITFQVLHTKKVGFVGKKFRDGSFPYQVDTAHKNTWSTTKSSREQTQKDAVLDQIASANQSVVTG